MTLELRRLQRDSHDACSSCADAFAEGDTAHAGFLASGVAAYLCDSCADQLIETSARYYWTPHPYERPPTTSFLWRYVDLAKFVSLLKDRAVYFARADKLGDPFEGAKGSIQRKPQWDSFYLEFYRNALRHPPPGVDVTFTLDEIEEKARRLLEDMESSGLRQRARTYVSCWHEGEHESEALWSRYGGHGNLAIAIRTTAGRLATATGDDPSVVIGRVRYLDFATEFAGVNEAFFRKRRSFQHEQEVRALVQIFDAPPDKEGHHIATDLDALIESVTVSPVAPSWFKDVVAELLDRFGVSVALRTSELLDQPFY